MPEEFSFTTFLALFLFPVLIVCVCVCVKRRPLVPSQALGWGVLNAGDRGSACRTGLLGASSSSHTFQSMREVERRGFVKGSSGDQALMEWTADTVHWPFSPPPPERQSHIQMQCAGGGGMGTSLLTLSLRAVPIPQ